MNKPTKLRLEHLSKVEPITANQSKAFKAFDDGYHLCLQGSAGTGKTFLSVALALEAVLRGEYKRVVIVRSAVPTRDLGYLPGTQEEKEDAYTAPYRAMINDLFQDGDAWMKVMQAGQVQFMSTSFIRGLTIDNSIVIVDEAQNCTYHELCSVITRLGENCRFVMCGDYYQSDFTKQNDKKGILEFNRITENMRDFTTVEFDFKDIVRSGFVRDFIMTKEMIERGEL